MHANTHVGTNPTQRSPVACRTAIGAVKWFLPFAGFRQDSAGKVSVPGTRRGVHASPGWRSRGFGGTIVISSVVSPGRAGPR
jgi:hypothetical protein